MAYRLSYTRPYPAAVATSFDRVMPSSLMEVFAHRHGPIPAVREVRGQDGAWGTPGQTRTIVLADGGTMHETLLGVDRPAGFDYRLTSFTGPLRPLVREVHGRWAFEPAGTGVRITWSWDVELRGRLGAVAERPLRLLWTGYARKAFDVIESLLLV